MVIFKNMGGLEIDLKFFLEKDKKFQIHRLIFDDISQLINSCNSNIDDFFFKKLFDKIDNKSEFTDDEKLKIKLILLKYIVYHEVKNDNSKASEIIEKALSNLPNFNSDATNYVIEGAILALDRKDKCDYLISNVVSSSIHLYKGQNKEDFARKVVNNVSDLASTKFKNCYVSFVRSAFISSINNLQKEHSLKNSIYIAKDLVSNKDDGMNNMKPQLSMAIGEDFFNCTQNNDYEDVVKEISNCKKLKTNKDFIDGFKNELKKHEILSKSINGLALGLGFGACATALGVGIVATAPAIAVVASTALIGATVGAGIGYVVSEVKANKLESLTKESQKI